jgi:ubiquinone/menaquinone biosynthesis C-methylase UbiE
MNGSEEIPPPTNDAAGALLPLLYDSEQSYGWSVGMRAITRALLAGLELPPGPLLEVGCGGAQFLAELAADHPDRAIYGVDLHPEALARARAQVNGQAALVCAPAERLPWPDATFALVLALDVFDQIGVDVAAALAESYRVLRPGGRLALRLSAHPWLYGPHDVAFHTGRRYTRRELVAALRAAGFAVRRVTYANIVLGGPVAAWRLLQRAGLASWSPAPYNNQFANTLAAWLLASEAAVLRRADLPVGLSLCVVGEKPGPSRFGSTDGPA